MKKYLESLLEARRRASGGENEALPTLDELKAEYIEYLLDRTFFNKTQTARILNISRAALYYRLALQQTDGSDPLIFQNRSRTPSSH